ncbi:MAG: hypothetical protein AseanaTS_17250 [Candidatus Pelagadaptatus aseana]|uniref:helix-turn-helix domain-containing protein n=1 Tax=Candidatus Pelagadaptatus aseana TaxID=3120508 RepID=UPI0039B1C2F2
MAQAAALLGTLKREFKALGITYKQIASQLDLSENSIKRLFSEQNTSLDRLEQLCDIAGISFTELVKKMELSQSKVEQLTVEQEKTIVSDPKLLLASICVLHYWSFDDIVSTYKISKTECIQLMAQLDRLKLIELLPLNRIRLNVTSNFRWRDDGPVQKYFRTEVQQDFFRSSFTNAGEKLSFMSGMLSRESHKRIEKKMENLVSEFNELQTEDSNLPLDDRFGSSLVLAIRAWEFSVFKELRREPNDKIF